MTHYPSKPADLAASLRALAVRIDTLGDVDLEPIGVAMSVSIQLHSYYGTQDERVTGVDTFAAALGIPTSVSGTLYGTDDRQALGNFDVTVFTAVKSEHEMALERENEQLRAQLAQRDTQVGEQA